jgi:hypothetical protein
MVGGTPLPDDEVERLRAALAHAHDKKISPLRKLLRVFLPFRKKKIVTRIVEAPPHKKSAA